MRKFRILLALVMLVAAILWLTMGSNAPRLARISEFSQIIPSAILSCLGTSVFWLSASLLFGRIYCATVCPVGTLQDIAVWSRRATRFRKSFRFDNGRNVRYPVLVAYVVSLLAGVLAVGYVVEPWNMMRNASAALRHDAVASTWGAMSGVGAAAALSVGIASGLVAVAGVMIWAWRSGRSFCTKVCPVGTLLGSVHQQTLMHIAIDPDKCVSCMKCADICSARCIDVVSRSVDNSRCVRCFDCIDVCPNDAIRFQINKDRHRQTPLLEPNP